MSARECVLFSYIINSGDRHDKTDFEGVSNKLDKMQINVYENEFYGAGHPHFITINGTLTEERI